MIWHPLPVFVLAADTFGTAAVLSAAISAMAVIAGWRPESSDKVQIRLESRAESASFHARFGLWTLAVSSLLVIAGIANVFAHLIPGAMCGTGVLQAMDGKGGRALTFRFMGLGILFAWQVVDRLNRRHAEAPLTVAGARTLLLAMPFLLLAWVDTAGSFLALKVFTPVDCCAAVYDRFGSLSDAVHTAGLPDAAWVGLAALIGLALAVAAATAVRCRPAPTPSVTGWVAALSVAWPPVAVIALVNVLAAYHYEVLQHHCPWCLFLPEHRFIGFLLFGLLALVLFEGVTACLAAGISQRFPGARLAAQRRSLSACRRLLLYVGVFVVTAGLPAVVWRVRFGVWLH